MDIVAAFTALRHELKLQVRNGRALQEELTASLERLAERLGSQLAVATPRMPVDESRKLAEALSEIEESLHRAVQTLAGPVLPRGDAGDGLLERFDRAASQASWPVRVFAKRFVRELRGLIESSASQMEQMREVHERTRRGLELLLQRVHRQMQRCQIERVDVLHQPFDAETMHAVDVIEAGVVPSAHVAEQLRPAYRWQGKILRPADVRIAR
jgi:molecular chaperone GrpE